MPKADIAKETDAQTRSIPTICKRPSLKADKREQREYDDSLRSG